VIALDEAAVGRSATEVCRHLRAGEPPVYVGHGRLSEGKLVVHPLHLDDAKVDVLARRLREELSGRGEKGGQVRLRGRTP
jgi:hypothetical protein